MIAISTKLNLLVLVLPIFLIVSVFLASFYLYKESFDASTLSTAVSSLTSAILVILLVWERLRDSLSKKLEYLHKNFIFKLYSEFRNPNLFWFQDKVRELKLDLNRYAKFLGLKLYPKNLMKHILEFLILHREFFLRYKEIENLAMKQLGIKHVNRDLLQYHMGSVSYTHLTLPTKRIV